MNERNEEGFAIGAPVQIVMGSMCGYKTHISTISKREDHFSYRVADVWFQYDGIRALAEDHTQVYRLIPHKLLMFEEYIKNGILQQEIALYKRKDGKYNILNNAIARERWSNHYDLIAAKLESKMIRWWSFEELNEYRFGAMQITEESAPNLYHFLRGMGPVLGNDHLEVL
jgi:hypothetical protein